jgi:hypothetical protein
LEGEIPLVAKDCPYGLGDLRGEQTGYGDLIQEWLKKVVIVFVDQGNVNGRAGKSAGGFQAGEACANDKNVGEMVCVHGCLSK